MPAATPEALKKMATDIRGQYLAKAALNNERTNQFHQVDAERRALGQKDSVELQQLDGQLAVIDDLLNNGVFSQQEADKEKAEAVAARTAVMKAHEAKDNELHLRQQQLRHEVENVLRPEMNRLAGRLQRLDIIAKRQGVDIAPPQPAPEAAPAAPAEPVAAVGAEPAPSAAPTAPAPAEGPGEAQAAPPAAQ